MLHIVARWLTPVVVLASVAGCVAAARTPDAGPAVVVTPAEASTAAPWPSPRPPTGVSATASAATSVPTATCTAVPAMQAPTATRTSALATQPPAPTRTPVPATQAPTRTRAASPVPTSLPTATPDPNPWSGCGHPYFPLLPQAHWRYAVTTRQGDAEPTPQAPVGMRVVSIESVAGRTIATVNYADERSDSSNYTFTVDCLHGWGVSCYMTDDTWPDYFFDCTASDPARSTGACPLPMPARFLLNLPAAGRLVPGYSWSGCSGSSWGSSGGRNYSTTYTIMATGPVVFEGRQYDGLKIREVEKEGMTPGGGVTIYNKITANAEKTYIIELARGVGMVRRVATGDIHCTSDAVAPADQEWACWSLSQTTDYTLLEFGAP